METRKIGSLDVTVVGIGCNNFGRRIDAAQTAAVVNAALEAGINFFDTADVYGDGRSEEFLGQALGARRNEAIIATKFGNTMEGQGHGAHPDYIRIAVDASLRRLNMDVIDLYQLHKPDPDVPVAETLGALNELVAAGKIREIGSSNFTAQMIRDAEAVSTGQGWARFLSVQNHYSLYHRDDEPEVLPECERLGIGYLPYFPLANGLLTGKYRKGQPMPEGTRLSGSRTPTEADLERVEKLIAFAESRGHTILTLAFSWLLSRPAVASVIAGATRPEQVHANAAASGWAMSAEDLAAVDAILAS